MSFVPRQPSFDDDWDIDDALLIELCKWEAEMASAEKIAKAFELVDQNLGLTVTWGNWDPLA